VLHGNTPKSLFFKPLISGQDRLMPLCPPFLRMSSRIFILGVCALWSLAAAGCGTNLTQYYFGDLFGKSSSTIDRNAEQLAVEGMEKMREKDYDDALKAFQKLKEQYPYSKYAILAELKLGDVYFQKEEYAEAALAYEEFARLHPRNEVIPYVIYQVGMSHFLTFTSIDRDPSETRQAMEAFQRVIQAFPDSQYAKKSREQMFECQKRLVAHEFYVGEFYYKQGRYRSAKERLERISLAYPDAVRDLGYEKPIQEMIEVSGRELDKGEAKPSVWTRIGF
jgi:outer membrane protein assembly factor BamD